MADTTPRSRRPQSRKGKVRKEFWLNPRLLKKTVLISRNTRDFTRIAEMTPFVFHVPFPDLSTA